MTRKLVIWPCAEVADVEAYFQHLEALISKSTDWRLHKDEKPLTPAVIAVYTGIQFDGDDLEMCVFESGPSKGNINFVPTAAVWAGVPANETTLTDEQINAAFRLFEPLARNAACQAGFRLSIVFSRPRQFRMPRKLRTLFNSFVYAGGLNRLHPCDWVGFYNIVHHTHKYRVEMRPKDLEGELLSRGVSEKVAAELAHLYCFGRDLLSRGRPWWN